MTELLVAPNGSWCPWYSKRAYEAAMAVTDQMTMSMTNCKTELSTTKRLEFVSRSVNRRAGLRRTVMSL